MIQTKQRQIILETIRAIDSHPTADELFQAIRPKMPTISLATVYRNLNFLAEAGEIRKLSMPGMSDRFDWKLDPHDHLVCETCGRLFDFTLPVDLKDMIGAASGMQVKRYTLVARGVCPACAAHKPAPA